MVMNTIKMAFASAALLALAASTFACAAPTDPQDPEPVVATIETGESTTPKMINQGGCTPAQLAMGAWEAGGVCFSGGGAGGGGGGGGSNACVSRCSSTEGKCEARCADGDDACAVRCLIIESRCVLNCH